MSITLIMEEEKETLKVIHQFSKTLKKVGATKVKNALTELYRNRLKDYDDKIVSFIKKSVCSAFSVDENDMKKPYLTENVFVCRTISIILIKKHVDLSHIDISNVFGKKNHSIVSHALTDFKSKNERIKEHKIFLDTYNEIDKKIIDFKQTLK